MTLNYERTVKHPVGFGTQVVVLDGDERPTVRGTVVGVATWNNGPASAFSRGYVIELDPSDRGWIDGRTYVSLLTVHEDAVRPIGGDR